MAPKKRRQENNKENTNQNCDPLSIKPIIDQSISEFEAHFNEQYKHYENKIQEKLAFVHKEFDKYLQTHESQIKLAQLLDQQITHITQQHINGHTNSPCQELLEKTSDFMNASSSDTSRSKTYLIGELRLLPKSHENK